MVVVVVKEGRKEGRKEGKKEGRASEQINEFKRFSLMIRELRE